MAAIGWKDEVVVVAGAGGFIGGHLVGDLLRDGCARVRAVDAKPLDSWHQRFGEADSRVLDLREPAGCRAAAEGAAAIFNLAADMGGMGFIETHKAECMLNVLINTQLLMAARDVGCRRYFFSSSACVYPTDRQGQSEVAPLRESDVYPAMPEDGYGWEKLYGERLCRHFHEDYGLATRVARYHNVYGPHGTWEGGRETAPAAICRKVAEASLSGRNSIEIWGDGEQTRSFLYVDDCLGATRRLMESEVAEPLNVGSDELVTINALVSLVEAIAGVELKRSYRLNAPRGVRGRNSDNRLIRRELGWAPSIRLEEGMEMTYRWIYDQVVARRR